MRVLDNERQTGRTERMLGEVAREAGTYPEALFIIVASCKVDAVRIGKRYAEIVGSSYLRTLGCVRNVQFRAVSEVLLRGDRGLSVAQVYEDHRVVDMLIERSVERRDPTEWMSYFQAVGDMRRTAWMNLRTC